MRLWPSGEQEGGGLRTFSVEEQEPKTAQLQAEGEEGEGRGRGGVGASHTSALIPPPLSPVVLVHAHVEVDDCADVARVGHADLARAHTRRRGVRRVVHAEGRDEAVLVRRTREGTPAASKRHRGCCIRGSNTPHDTHTKSSRDSASMRGSRPPWGPRRQFSALPGLSLVRSSAIGASGRRVVAAARRTWCTNGLPHLHCRAAR